MEIKLLSKKDMNLIKRTLLYTRYYKKRFILLILIVLLGIIFTIVQPMLWGKLSGGLTNRH